MFLLGKLNSQLQVSLILAFCLTCIADALAADMTELSTSRDVLKVLDESRGDALIAFLDNSLDQSNVWKNLQVALKKYTVELNGQPLGTTSRNTLIKVTPRTGLNRLFIRNIIGQPNIFQVLFPAVRSAGSSTTIVEVVMFSDSDEVLGFSLKASDVQMIQEALQRNGSGGMDRVFQLIRSRGQELVAEENTLKNNWSSGFGSGSRLEDGDSHDANALIDQRPKVLEELVGTDQTIETDGSDGLNSAPEIKDRPDNSSFKVSADRR